MQLEEIIRHDPNNLPYRIWHESGEGVKVCFLPLLATDRVSLVKPPWTDALFRASWPDFVGEPRTLKLVKQNGGTHEILGIVRLGEVPSGVSFLMRSLLETNPECQSINARGTKYRGIGRVLIARLVAESYNLGTQGQIRVKAHPRARGFYEALGFIPSKKLAIDGGLNLAYDLFAEVAGKIFDKATESSEREL